MLTPLRQQNKRSPQPLAPFRPLDWQYAPLRDKSPVVLLTGSAGGGKSRTAGEKTHAYTLKYSGATVLIARKVKVSMTSGAVLMMDRKVIGPDPRVRHYPSKSRFEYTNTSILAYLGLEDKKQRDRLKSIGQDGAVDFVWMEEANEFEESDYNALIARMRGKAASWRQIILTCNPDAPTHWIYTRLIQGGEARVYYSGAVDNPYNPDDYLQTLDRLTGIDHERMVKGLWVQASGLVFDTWSDGPDDGNVTEAADFIPDAGPVLWAVDDGYVGKLEPSGFYSANSHPRVFLLCQLRPTGQLCIFAESFAVELLSDTHIQHVLAMGYPVPDYAVVDKSAAELKGRLYNEGIYTKNGPSDVEESIKEARRWIAKDQNGVRKVLVHPRCKHLRAEMVSYRREDATGKIVKAHDHGTDALRYVIWSLRYN